MRFSLGKAFILGGVSVGTIFLLTLVIRFAGVAFLGQALVGFELEKSEISEGLQLSVFAGSGGATTGQIHKIFLNRSDEEIMEDDLILSVDRVDEIQVNWERSNLVSLCISGGRVFYFRGYRAFYDGSSLREVHVALRNLADCRSVSDP